MGAPVFYGHGGDLRPADGGAGACAVKVLCSWYKTLMPGQFTCPEQIERLGYPQVFDLWETRPADGGAGACAVKVLCSWYKTLMPGQFTCPEQIERLGYPQVFDLWETSARSAGPVR